MSDDLKCVAGCVAFYGGEKKHHKDCPHYPESFTKVNADRIEALEVENAKLRSDMRTTMNALVDAARARGEAEGKLAASEMAGVLDGWIEKCAALETKLSKAVVALSRVVRKDQDAFNWAVWTLAEIKNDART